jgi:FlaG/FlaF family flagellin (archaellin)
MKGISTFIATILLIAFTVAVGGIISLFLTGFTKTQTGTAESIGTNVTKCGGISIDVLSVTGTTIVIVNPSSQTITSISLIPNNGTAISLGSLSLASAGTNSTTWQRGTNTSVTAYGLCLSSVAVKGACNSGESCWSSS